MSDTPDVLIADEGTLWTVEPLSGVAREWLDQNVQSEPYQWLGRVLAVEHRMIGDIIQGMRDAGLDIGTR